ncbi:hypothetical protein [Flavobacterium hibisci]|uniref:hypothetical protein n=1 Tax=Flavobacterium hibisci TaxID=1914462 RepID=UPI001CBC87AF|nr:hypothetical protein [Flavobacterium hibisci]MBZ4043364.1 hypothetical protein [Flavobacterium hibisci]
MNHENYQESFDREKLELEEKDAIDVLINWKDGKFYDLRHLHSIVAPDLEIQEYLEIKGLYIATNVLRQDLGFDKNEKPGDFDLVIIPFTKEKILFERTGACEVKIVRPTRAKPQRNANSLGLTQLKGLISDGFPFVGLMHISMTEPLLNHEKWEIDFCTIPANGDEKIAKGKTLEDYLVKVKMDTFQWYSADQQMKRLISTDVPKYVNLLCFGLSKNTMGEYVMDSCSVKFSDFGKGYFNPNLKHETIEKVKTHFENFQHIYHKRIMRE